MMITIKSKRLLSLHWKIQGSCSWHLQFKIQNTEIPVVFRNGSTYDYHFIVNQLAKEFNDQVECLGENTEKYITFSVPVKKELDNNKTITYKLKFIDNF